MANAEIKEILKRIDDVIEQSWNHVTPGTADYHYVQQFKRNLREAISPTPEQPAAPASATITKKQD